MQRAHVDAVLATWGERLFYPSVRTYGRPGNDLRIDQARMACGARVRAQLRALIDRAPEVMVKVRGGGRGMGAIRAHMHYISRRGALEIEDEQGEKSLGREALRELVEDWRLAGAEIPSKSHRREALNIMLSMPPDTDSHAVLWAAREFARAEFAQHKFAMVLHEPQADPRSKYAHVHLVVRGQGLRGQRLNPGKADLARWRQAFADRLMELGVAASATRQVARGEIRNYPQIWEVKAAEKKSLRRVREPVKTSGKSRAARIEALRAWQCIARALAQSDDREDRALALQAMQYVQSMPVVRESIVKVRGFAGAVEPKAASAGQNRGRER